MKKFAVMGEPIQHSLSPQIHALFAEQTGIKLSYQKILVNPSQLEAKVREFFAKGGSGLNITLPCKEQAYALADEQSKRCQKVLAANTLWFADGKIYADNTDGVGFGRDLERYVQLAGKRVLIIGAGGATRGILGFLLTTDLASCTVTNRTFSKAQLLQSNFPEIEICEWGHLTPSYDIIINATSAGINQQALVLPVQLITAAEFCYDLSYQIHGSTPFVQYAKENGTRAADGLGMLVEQAAEAFKLWHGILLTTESCLDNLRP